MPPFWAGVVTGAVGTFVMSAIATIGLCFTLWHGDVTFQHEDAP